MGTVMSARGVIKNFGYYTYRINFTTYELQKFSGVGIKLFVFITILRSRNFLFEILSLSSPFEPTFVA